MHRHQGTGDLWLGDARQQAIWRVISAHQYTENVDQYDFKQPVHDYLRAASFRRRHTSTAERGIS
jgi:hypothetical protein